MALKFDMKMGLRLILTLLLFLAAVGPACLIMSPAMAMASDAPSNDCSSPGAPSTSCPHATAAKAFQPSQEVTHELPAAVLAYTPLVPSACRGNISEPTVATHERPVAHLTPLRL